MFVKNSRYFFQKEHGCHTLSLCVDFQRFVYIAGLYVQVHAYQCSRGAKWQRDPAEQNHLKTIITHYCSREKKFSLMKTFFR